MGHSTPLLRKALKSARLASKNQATDFWDKPIGKAKLARQEYIQFSTQVPVNKKVIFYEAMSGDRIGDNPFGIFDYLLSHPKYGKYLHVWSVSASGDIPDRFKNTPNVVFARRGTRSFAYFLASAHYLICNANLPGYFTRRPQQRYLNTWHGIPYKALGRNSPKARYGTPTGVGTFLKATHVLTPCGFMTRMAQSAYSMAGASTATIAETGYPRVDLTVNIDRDSQEQIRNQLGIEPLAATGKNRPTVLYAPTWRADGGEDVVDTEQLIEDLQALAQLDIQLIYRGHHRMHRLIQDAIVGDQIGDVFIPPEDISSNELLTVVDVLITDYSSIFFDFLPTGRPIVHYLYDLEEYKQTRGLNLELEELPGSVALSQRELLDAVAESAVALDEVNGIGKVAEDPVQGDRYKIAQNRFCPHEDGTASRRAIEFFLKDRTNDLRLRQSRDGRPTAAFWAGSLSIGPETDAFIQALFESANSTREQTVLIIDRETPTDKNVMKQIRAFGDKVSAVPYNVGPPTLLPTEESEYYDFVSGTFASFEEVKEIVHINPVLNGIFSYEYRRRLDDAQFDSVTVAPGLTNHELALATYANRATRLPAGRRTLPAEKTEAKGSASIRFARGAADKLLPKGSGQRQIAARIYKTARNSIKRR
ncbi:CDP-glycerol glycerophosphotransferase family protein [Brevibacterium antiquum]|uniref:CDP-glycerol glycerophosphotransferase family protein n=1 Tax=Brevibacterium antiquum TaxID=234835 RepID=UPI0018E057C3|nr:CDP-glycerol glycerophosphotransferase family protein [Brevibacterium antiquum]